MKKTNQGLRGSLLLLAAAIIWGLAFSAQDMAAAAGVGVFSCGASRSLVATLFLTLAVLLFDKLERNGRFLFSRRKTPLTKRELIAGVACGVALAIASALQQAGIETSGAGKAAFITAMYVVFVPIFGALLFRRHTPLHLWIAVLISLCGLWLITMKSGASLATGDILLLLCSFCFCGQVLLVDYFLPTVNGVRLSLVQFATCTVLNAVFALLFEPAPFAGVFAAVLPLLFLGIASSGIAYTLQILGQRYCPPAPAAIIMSTESLFGVLGAALVLGERLIPREYLGCAVVFAAVLLSQLPLQGRRKREIK